MKKDILIFLCCVPYKSCWGLIQKISDLERNRKIIWEEFLDFYE